MFDVALAVGLSSGCDDDMRGTNAPSRDGNTWLIVDDDNGGGCPILVDGNRWRRVRPRVVRPAPDRVWRRNR